MLWEEDLPLVSVSVRLQWWDHILQVSDKLKGLVCVVFTARREIQLFQILL